MTIEELLARTLKISAGRVTDGTAMKDVAEWDSLKHMELIAAIEERYKIELTGDEIADMTSIGAIKKALKRYGI